MRPHSELCLYQILTSKGFFYSGLEQAVHILSSALDDDKEPQLLHFKILLSFYRKQTLLRIYY